MVSFLMIGQSNMAGRGAPEEVDPIANDRLYVLRNGRFQKMYVPVNPDRRTSGVSLAESFADAVSKEFDTDVGLIPCADGGTRLDQWMPGEALYDHAVFQAKLAQRSSRIAGVLWHQGESDSRDGRHLLYKEKCLHILSSFRKDLGLDPEIPFITGGIGDFIVDFKEGKFRDYVHVNNALKTLAREEDWIEFVSAENLPDKGDSLHFSSPALREFGLRYFEAFKGANRLLKKGENEAYQDQMTEIERL